MAARGAARIVTVNRDRLRLFRQRFRGPTLGVLYVCRDGTHYIALADDVAGPDVAPAIRHLIDVHADPGGPAICRAPACAGYQQWRQAPLLTTSTA